MSDWHIEFNGGIYTPGALPEDPPVLVRNEIRAKNYRTGEYFVGLPAEFEAVSKNLPRDSGSVPKTGAGVIFTSGNVSGCSLHRIINTHATEALTVDVSFDAGSTWSTGVEVLLQDGTYATSVAAGKYATLSGKFDQVRLSCADDAAGRLTSYTSAQV